METTLKKKVTILQIEKLFEDRETLNIRFFKCIDANFSEDLQGVGSRNGKYLGLIIWSIINLILIDYIHY